MATVTEVGGRLQLESVAALAWNTQICSMPPQTLRGVQ